MASDRQFIEFLLDQIKDSGEVTYKAMFGEYGLYADGKLFALVCDNKLFIKPTPSGRSFIGEVVEAPPYPGAKSSFLIEEQLEDGQWLSQLINLSLPELPEPKPKSRTPKEKK